MKKSHTLPPGLEKYCAGILEFYKNKHTPTTVKRAEGAIGTCYGTNANAQNSRDKLIQMVKCNLINRKAYPREYLNRRYGMHISKDELAQEKQKFCIALLKESGLDKWS